MFLKSIEVQGFKSFANKTVFRFENGITGIVGPNGSGKSNVADAVRWVLGEQRIKQLRGGNMQDVIFAGTQNRKPLGYASVAITLDNTDHMLPVSYDEITVSRRLYRSGESEYLINGTACRLKDINELFYDTGIGKEGYSIIGQGQIDKILSGKPEERRELFDEAAGIVKFKRRKTEAVRKLENEQQNLLRINDILAELGRQLGPLEKQSEKAKLFLKKKEELKYYDVNLFLYELEDLREKTAQARQNHESAKAELDQVNEQIDQIRAEYDSVSLLMEEKEKQQNELTAHVSAIKLTRQEQLARIDLITEQIRSADEKKQQRSERLLAIEEELKDRQSKEEETQHQIQESHLSQEQLREKEESLLTQHAVLTSQLEKTQQDVSTSHDEQIRLLNERTQIQTKAQAVDTLLEQVNIKKAQLSGRILELKSEENTQAQELKNLGDVCDTLENSISSVNEESEQINESLIKVQEQLSDMNQRMEKDQVEYHRDSSRLESLKNIAERYDGYGSSIRKVMEQKKKIRGIHGVVADLIATKKNYETAIETALGGSIQNIVTDDEETAKKLIAFLKENKYGRATFLPLTAMGRSEPFRQVGALNEKGVIGLASTLVKTEPRFAALTSYLLGRTVVVDDIDHAAALARKYKYTLRIVTLEGEYLSPGGAMTGGAFRNASNLLGRRREIEELENLTKTQKEALEKLREDIDRTREERNELRDRIRAYSERLQKLYLEKNTADMKYAQLKEQIQQGRQQQDEILSRKNEAGEQILDLKKDRQEAMDELSASKDQEKALLAKEEKTRSLYDKLKDEEGVLLNELQSLRLAQVSLTEKKEYLQRELTRFEEEKAALHAEKTSLRAQEESASEELALSRQEIDTLRQSAAQLQTQIEEEENKAQELGRSRSEINEKQKAFFDRSEDLSVRSRLLDKEVYRLSSQLERMEETKEARIAYMWEEYELTSASAAQLKRDDLGSRTNWKRSMNTLRAEIRDLGNVNVNAIEEYREVSERHAFLSGQHDDLVKAEEALRVIIQKLDVQMRQQFKEQFSRIQEEFNQSFRHLFGGGNGTLELVEEEDLLDAGIRIIAQPPGKKLQNMMQLSGGEKSLTAIALLFAIQNLKPSPFCLLDEIEASLDESNVDRYARYLHKLTKHTQFIIITHRRGTMTAADRLYGVTMQEKGVSALVSVNLIESELDS